MSGNGNNLLNFTTAFPTMDRSFNANCAYHFNKVNNDSLHTPFAGFVNNLTTSPFSISLWYQPTGTRPVWEYELLIGRGNSGTGLHCPDTWGQWSVGIYDCRKAVVGFDQYSHWESPVTSLTCAQLLAAISGNWHHLAFVYNGSGSYDLYIDGTLYNNSHGPCGFMSGNIDPLVLGRDYTGDLDDVIIYNRALTPAEVTALYGLNGSCCNGTSSSNKPSNNGAHIQTPAPVDGIQVYPNPTYDEVAVFGGNSTIRSIAVYDNTGVLVSTYQFSHTKVMVNMEHLAPGIYFMKVVTDAGSSIQKVIKQ